ncbi:MAG: PD40 domain-containing protein [Prevotella sp.]|nr:PD40 domain-containing protein [Prevotella sp.]MBR1545807.1 PD40 domain-containing protein [Prevotella sp.]
MRKRLPKTCLILMMACLLVGCTSRPQNVTKVNQQPIIYPDYTDVTIPIGIAPLNFSMADDKVTTVDVVVKGSKTGTLHANGEYADFDIDEWHQLLEDNKGGQLLVTVCAEREGRWTQYRDFTIHVSNHALDEWGITYRRIPPSYELYSGMGLYQRDLSNFKETALLENTQSPGMCLNCHTANRTRSDQYVFHVRGKHGATVVHQQGKEEFLQAKNAELGGSMVYPYWHPDGRYCAFSTNATTQMFHFNGNKRIEVYDTKSDVFVYDTKTHTILKDTLTMRYLWAECTPAFSPDGKWLYFTTARRQVYPTDYNKERYSLCRVAFDAKTGKLGQQVDTLLSADQTGKSMTWPRPSYDGRYLMYTVADYGYFSIWHPEADLWLLDLQTGASRPMTEVNSPCAESFHNWNTNSHWFLFTSRRDDGLYTRIYLSSIEDGKATKPFMLPQRNPKAYYQRLLYSYNTPDFSDGPIKPHARERGNTIESDQRVATTVKPM